MKRHLIFFAGAHSHSITDFLCYLDISKGYLQWKACAIIISRSNNMNRQNCYRWTVWNHLEVDKCLFLFANTTYFCIWTVQLLLTHHCTFYLCHYTEPARSFSPRKCETKPFKLQFHLYNMFYLEFIVWAFPLFVGIFYYHSFSCSCFFNLLFLHPIFLDIHALVDLYTHRSPIYTEQNGLLNHPNLVATDRFEHCRKRRNICSHILYLLKNIWVTLLQLNTVDHKLIMWSGYFYLTSH